MTDQPPAKLTVKVAPGETPAWLPEARELASTCHGLAFRASEIDSRQPLAYGTLTQTGKLLNSIGDHLEHVVSQSSYPENGTDPVELSLHLIDFAKELPMASTALWKIDPAGSTADLSRSLPELSVALMSLSQHVSEASPHTGAVVQCTI
ncbi:MAG: hypothetical protein R3F19_25315 [Verrucomicrobiales bacterium]|nr:hypothetical protein [Verrucomicrobiae bacterium]